MACLLSGALVLAQSPAAGPQAGARVRIGPVACTPRLALRNLGWDSNVSGHPENPEGVLTTTFAGLVHWWMRAGNLRFVGFRLTCWGLTPR
jgi:hypothetical protein